MKTPRVIKYFPDRWTVDNRWIIYKDDIVIKDKSVL